MRFQRIQRQIHISGAYSGFTVWEDERATTHLVPTHVCMLTRCWFLPLGTALIFAKSPSFFVLFLLLSIWKISVRHSSSPLAQRQVGAGGSIRILIFWLFIVWRLRQWEPHSDSKSRKQNREYGERKEKAFHFFLFNWKISFSLDKTEKLQLQNLYLLTECFVLKGRGLFLELLKTVSSRCFLFSWQ